MLKQKAPKAAKAPTGTEVSKLVTQFNSKPANTPGVKPVIETGVNVGKLSEGFKPKPVGNAVPHTKKNGSSNVTVNGPTKKNVTVENATKTGTVGNETKTETVGNAPKKKSNETGGTGGTGGTPPKQTSQEKRKAKKARQAKGIFTEGEKVKKKTQKIIEDQAKQKKKEKGEAKAKARQEAKAKEKAFAALSPEAKAEASTPTPKNTVAVVPLNPKLILEGLTKKSSLVNSIEKSKKSKKPILTQEQHQQRKAFSEESRKLESEKQKLQNAIDKINITKLNNLNLLQQRQTNLANLAKITNQTTRLTESAKEKGINNSFIRRITRNTPSTSKNTGTNEKVVAVVDPKTGVSATGNTKTGVVAGTGNTKTEVPVAGTGVAADPVKTVVPVVPVVAGTEVVGAVSVEKPVAGNTKLVQETGELVKTEESGTGVIRLSPPNLRRQQSMVTAINKLPPTGQKEVAPVEEKTSLWQRIPGFKNIFGSTKTAKQKAADFKKEIKLQETANALNLEKKAKKAAQKKAAQNELFQSANFSGPPKPVDVAPKETAVVAPKETAVVAPKAEVVAPKAEVVAPKAEVVAPKAEVEAPKSPAPAVVEAPKVPEYSNTQKQGIQNAKNKQTINIQRAVQSVSPNKSPRLPEMEKGLNTNKQKQNEETKKQNEKTKTNLNNQLKLAEQKQNITGIKEIKQKQTEIEVAKTEKKKYNNASAMMFGGYKNINTRKTKKNYKK
jgi:hypothetical protein